MSTATGEIHRASAPMAGRIVLVAGPMRRAERIRADLAKAAWGVWRRVGAEWNIDEDREAVKARASARLAKRIEVIGKAQRTMLSKAESRFDRTQALALAERLRKMDAAVQTNSDRVYQTWLSTADAMPSMIALRRAVAALDTKELAAQEGVVVYSDRPTRLQRALPREGVAAIRQLERDQTVWSDVVTDDQSWREGRGVRTMDPRLYADPAGQGSLRLILRTEEDGGGGAIRCTAWFVDKNLKLKQFAETELPLTGTWREPGDAPKADSNERPIELSEETVAHAKALVAGAIGPMRSLIAAPDRREPLDFLAAEACRGVAKARNVALVAWLPDRLILEERKLAQKPKIVGPTPSEWLQALWVASVDAIPTDDSLILRPRAIPVQVDRRDLTVLLQAVVRDGYPSLDAISVYSASRDDAYAENLCIVSLDAVMPGSSQFLGTDWRTFALWGSLTPPQRRALLQNQTISWDRLSASTRGRFLRAILNAPLNDLHYTAAPRQGFLSISEPSELLAGGFTSDGAIKGQTSIEEAVILRSPEDGSGYPSPVSSERLADAVWMRERVPGEGVRDGLPDTLPTSFVPGRTVTFGFTMTLTPNVIWSKSGQHGEFNLASKPVPLEALPKGFLNAFQQRLDFRRKHLP
ncbi:hypothetical protein EON82_01425 [bacterium]|nr:MAG: hypothetical protein EON82_01425 [bacterium]